jgi:hypothetical protein
MAAFRIIKHFLAITTGGVVLIGMVAIVSAAVFFLCVIPWGLRILTMEFERLKRWLRDMPGRLMRTNP